MKTSKKGWVLPSGVFEMQETCYEEERKKKMGLAKLWI